jgi:ubiquinone/menaquinone biosynthesis C-methylase UbiE
MEMKRASQENSVKDCVSVTVCDIKPEMLAVGKKRAIEKYGNDMIESNALSFHEGNAECFPFDDNSFDLYTISFGLRNVTDTSKALRDAHRVLKKGGRFMHVSRVQ